MLQIVLREAQEDPELAGGSFTEELTATPTENKPRPGAALGRTRHPVGVAAAWDHGQENDGKALHRRHQSSRTARADQFAADAVVSCARATPSCCRGDVKGSDVPRTAAVPLQLP